jgi:hypothetical protein
MELITKSQLRSVRNSFEKAKGFSAFSEIVNESKTRKSTATEVTVFLSHKHDELEELKDAIALLKKFGVNIYIDHNDEEMPKRTSGVTAEKLKKKIKENKKFILLATEKAIASKWCNWELGFGDAHKYINHIALLIVKEDNASWSGSEYLQIYPVIGKKYSWSEDYYEVEFPDKRIVDLKTWLNS